MSKPLSPENESFLHQACTDICNEIINYLQYLEDYPNDSWKKRTIKELLPILGPKIVSMAEQHKNLRFTLLKEPSLGTLQTQPTLTITDMDDPDLTSGHYEESDMDVGSDSEEEFASDADDVDGPPLQQIKIS